MKFKIHLLTYRALNKQAPFSLKDPIVPYQLDRGLCSETAGFKIRMGNSA